MNVLNYLNQLINKPQLTNNFLSELVENMKVDESSIISIIDAKLKDVQTSVINKISYNGPLNPTLRHHRFGTELIRNSQESNSIINYTLKSFGFETPFEVIIKNGIIKVLIPFNFLNNSNLIDQAIAMKDFRTFDLNDEDSFDIEIEIFDINGIEGIFRLINLINFSLFLTKENTLKEVFFLNPFRGLSYSYSNIKDKLLHGAVKIISSNVLGQWGLRPRRGNNGTINNEFHKNLERLILYLNFRHSFSMPRGKKKPNMSEFLRSFIDSLVPEFPQPQEVKIRSRY